MGEEGEFPDRLDKGSDDCGDDEIHNGDHQTGGLTAAAAIRSLVFWEGFGGRIRQEFVLLLGDGRCRRWECGTREMVGLPGGLLGLLGLPCGSLWGEGQPIKGRQSPEAPPGSGPETILLKEKFEAISTLKEPSRLVRSAEGLNH